MKPLFETPSVPEGQSWSLLNRRLADDIPFQWHYHREYELTLTLNSRGQRFVGDHIGAYDDGDLVLLGPNLPHTWASAGKCAEAAPHVALVLWFRPDWIDGLMRRMPELTVLRPMLAAADRGLRYSDATAAATRPAIEALIELPPAKRLLALLDLLVTLSADPRATSLAGPAHRAPRFSVGERNRIERVLDHIHAHYHEQLRIEPLADLAHLSVSGLHRIFRRQTGMTVLDYVARLRIGRACQLLIATNKPIAHVAGDVGYENLSHFNRQFRRQKAATPREFRRRFARAEASARPEPKTVSTLDMMRHGA